MVRSASEAVGLVNTVRELRHTKLTCESGQMLQQHEGGSAAIKHVETKYF